MTEAIKQWIADQGQANSGWTGLLSDNSRTIYSSGLTKGIEIAEGFAEWITRRDIQRSTIPKHYTYEGSTLTTSELLEKYLSHLLNKEK